MASSFLPDCLRWGLYLGLLAMRRNGICVLPPDCRGSVPRVRSQELCFKGRGGSVISSNSIELSPFGQIGGALEGRQKATQIHQEHLQIR
jgi:hypothetical protein